MATLAESLVPSSSRKLPIRKRPDLMARRQRYQGRNYWVVKDPVGLQYYRFEEEEFAILQMLDGESSLEDIAEQFEREFPPQTIRTEELQQFIGQLHRSGLVITDAAGQGLQLKKRRDERAHKQRIAQLTNILCIRFKGVDPERLLNFLYPYVRWFFTVPALVAAVLLGLSALSLVIVQFDVFYSKLPSFQTFFSADKWLLLGVTLALTKILHEFGHGLSCKHFGGECHELGVMVLVLTPCLYCNVSDSWMLPNRWHRAAIGAAGMYVELVLASIATFVWWFTEPGLLNYVSLNIMFICSVSTILFNGNPLLRFDGYYILSDILEIPNLRQKASTILNRTLRKWCLGYEEPEDPTLPKGRQWLFATYTVAAAIYRWVIVLSILYFLNKVFEPYGLKILGQLIALTAMYGLVIQPLVKLYKFFAVPGRLGKVKRGRMHATLGVLAVAIAAVVLIPLPAHVYAPLEVQPRGAASVYVEMDGILEEIYVKPGDYVEAGQPLAQLSNIELEIRIAQLLGQRNEYRARLESLQRVADRQARAQIRPIQEMLDSVTEQIAQREIDREKLRLVASRAGTVLPPPRVPDNSSADGQLVSWSGSPLERENLGAALRIGNKFCLIGDPEKLEAVILINQDDVEFVREGQQVEMMLAQSADWVYRSTIHRVATENRKITPASLSSIHGGVVPTQMDASGVPRPLTPVYDALANLSVNRPDNPHDLLRIGQVGTAKIKIDPRTLGNRLWRYLSRTFNFDL